MEKTAQKAFQIVTISGVAVVLSPVRSGRIWVISPNAAGEGATNGNPSSINRYIVMPNFCSGTDLRQSLACCDIRLGVFG
jgi:hypothetical protein